jgi:hypothetical protein
VLILTSSGLRLFFVAPALEIRGSIHREFIAVCWNARSTGTDETQGKVRHRMMDLVAGVRSAKAVAAFIEGGPLASTLADLGVKAAKDAVDDVPYAVDKEARIQQAVTHLQGAKTALESSAYGRWKWLIRFRMPRLVHLLLRLKYTLALMAILYRYLGERALSEKSISEIYVVDANIRIVQAEMEVEGMVSFPMNYVLSPWNIVEEPWYALRGNKPYIFDTNSFHIGLAATWEEGAPKLLGYREYGW